MNAFERSFAWFQLQLSNNSIPDIASYKELDTGVSHSKQGGGVIDWTCQSSIQIEGYRMVNPRLCETARPLFKNPRPRLKLLYRDIIHFLCSRV